VRQVVGRGWPQRGDASRGVVVSFRSDPEVLNRFATVRLRTKITKGPGSRAAGIAMAYKLIDAAQVRWHAVNAPHLVALGRLGPYSTRANYSNAPSTSRPPNRANQPKRRSNETTSSTGRDNISSSS
jgi:putative transposase